ncbi:hypothetical protein F4703DRAFT_1965088 [Phycomyces blakesleeanus]
MRDVLCAFANVNSQSVLYLNGCKLSYIKNGSEEFLRLKAFDPTKDMPVKILHIIPLGLTKYLMTFLWKHKMLTTKRSAGNGTRSVRSSIGDFVKLAPVNFPGFNLHFFGSCVNSDNSRLSTPTLCNTLADVFQSNGQLFLGQVNIIQARDSADRMRKAFFMQKYQIVPNSIVVLPLGGLVEVNKDDINIVQTVDIHLSVGSSNN